MRKTIKARLGVLAATTIGLTAFGLPSAVADEPPADAVPQSELKLTIWPSDGGPVIGEMRSVVLECQPPGGDHPTPEESCKALTAAGGDFGKLGSDGGVCSAVVDPVTVFADGHWHSREVTYAETFTNACVAADRTGGVFAF